VETRIFITAVLAIAAVVIGIEYFATNPDKIPTVSREISDIAGVIALVCLTGLATIVGYIFVATRKQRGK